MFRRRQATRSPTVARKPIYANVHSDYNGGSISFTVEMAQEVYKNEETNLDKKLTCSEKTPHSRRAGDLRAVAGTERE